MGLDDKVSS